MDGGSPAHARTDVVAAGQGLQSPGSCGGRRLQSTSQRRRCSSSTESPKEQAGLTSGRRSQAQPPLPLPAGCLRRTETSWFEPSCLSAWAGRELPLQLGARAGQGAGAGRYKGGSLPEALTTSGLTRNLH